MPLKKGEKTPEAHRIRPKNTIGHGEGKEGLKNGGRDGASAYSKGEKG